MTKTRKILLFISTVVLLNIITAFVFLLIINKNSQLILSEISIQKKDDYRYVFTGDSRVVRSIDVSSLDNSFNYAYYGENPILTYYKIVHLVEDLGIIPETIVIQTDLTRFSRHYASYQKNKFYYKNFVNYSELYSLGIISSDEYLKSMIIKTFPYLEFITVIKRTNNTKHDNQKTFRESSDKEREQASKNLIQKDLQINSFEDLSFSTSLEYLEKTIVYCEEKGIKLLSIKYPVTDYFLNAVNSTTQYKSKSILLQDSLLIKHKVPTIDLEVMYSKSYELFSDCHHLNAAGKRKITVQIEQILFR